MLPLDHESAENAAHEGLGPAEWVVIFTCTFFSLLILGFRYAVMAGRTGEGSDLGVAVHGVGAI